MSDGLESTGMEFPTRNVRKENTNPLTAKQPQQQQQQRHKQHQQEEEKGFERNASSARFQRAQEASKNGSLKLSSQVTDSADGLALSKSHRYFTYGGHHLVFFRHESFDALLSGAHVLPSLASGSFGALASVRCAI